MSGPVESYFSKHPFLPVQPSVRKRLRAVVSASQDGHEARRAVVEETAYASPLFSFNLLKFVNSPIFNLKTKIVTLKQAVTLPTFEKLGELTEAMPEYAVDMEDRVSMKRFEEHGRSTAAAVFLLSALGRRFSTIDRERLYSAALLHDVGRVFLLMSDVEGYLRVHAEGAPLSGVIEAEKKYFGTDHATLGSLAVEGIGITDEWVLDSVRHHHSVPSGPGVLVAYADRLVKRFGLGPSETAPVDGDSSGNDEARLKVALEEAVHMTVGEVLMHVLSEIDPLLMSGVLQYKPAGAGTK